MVNNNIKVCSKNFESISRFAYNFFIFHPISIIFWQIKGIANHFMLSEKCFGKMKINAKKMKRKIYNFFNIASMDLKITQVLLSLLISKL